MRAGGNGSGGDLGRGFLEVRRRGGDETGDRGRWERQELRLVEGLRVLSSRDLGEWLMVGQRGREEGRGRELAHGPAPLN
jgi:hypothetical protein